MAIATQNPPVATTVTTPRKRVVRWRPAPAPAPAAPVVPAAPPFHVSLQPRTAFWRARKQELEAAENSLAELRKIDAGIGGVAGQVGALQFPTSIGVTTTMSAVDAAVIERLTQAVEKVANTLPSRPGGDCAGLSTLSPRAFSLIARLTTLMAHLVDRHEVSATSVLRKLEQDSQLIVEARELLVNAKLADALEPFDVAFRREPFDVLADRSQAVFDELEHRAALLLAIQCLVATSGLEGDALDWPPPASPPHNPIGVAARAPQKPPSRPGRA